MLASVGGCSEVGERAKDAAGGDVLEPADGLGTGDLLGTVEVDAPTDVGLDGTPPHTPDAGWDAGPSGCVTHQDCEQSMGMPAAPETPCGGCWAVCEKQTCDVLCYEAATCVFTAGCGPNCEPLCDTSDDCFPDQGGVCVEGICEWPEG